MKALIQAVGVVVLTRDRLMGIGQAITMPLFFGSNALYPVSVMPGRLQTVSRINPLSYLLDPRPTGPLNAGHDHAPNVMCGTRPCMVGRPFGGFPLHTA